MQHGRIRPPVLHRLLGIRSCWSGQCGLCRRLRRPEVGSEDLVPDPRRGNSAGQQVRANVPHERQRPAGEDLDPVRQRDLREVHQPLLRPAVTAVDGLVPGVGGEIVDVPGDVQHRVPQGVVVRGPVGVRHDDRALRLGSRDGFDDR